MKAKTFLSDLPMETVRAIFDNNESIRNIAFDRATDNMYYFLQNEFFTYFEHYNENGTPRRTYTADIEDDNYGNIHIFVQERHYIDFLEDCARCTSFYLDDKPELNALIIRLLEKRDTLDDILSGYSDLSDNNEDKFLTWYADSVEKIADELRAQMQAEHDSIYDPDFVFESWYYGDVETGTDFYIIDSDFSTVYEDITRRYA